MTITVTTLVQLNAAILAADAEAANSGTVAIALGADIALDGVALDVVNLQKGVTLDLIGNGYTLDGGGTEQGLFVYAGTVDVSNLAINNMLARGGSGDNGGGGGAGLGGGLFIGSSVAGDAGNVTLTDAAFSGDAAHGGNTVIGFFFGAGGGLDGLGAPYGAGGAGARPAQPTGGEAAQAATAASAAAAPVTSSQDSAGSVAAMEPTTAAAMVSGREAIFLSRPAPR
jgi:hypothetical protein